ncbi:MBL fold metallo-hydrolase [Solihabitans fulvus]|uniref:MBL fold metallo-hydrolase n=1 Tax=Solihabitans fulvus TaxID=1892852 RepID=A0A5B2WT64_9PSEU|nr:MBL fold metallo-hydrolase [Solihabitans fulvus]KAA2255223.1 MBL fold metallo-hydrolase [Solihabitans fulvus]
MIGPAPRATVELGDTRVTYLPDGHAWFTPESVFPTSSREEWATHAAYLDDEGRFPVSVGSFLVRTADRVMLVDLGLGDVSFDVPGFGSFQGGGLLRSLAEEGLRPQDVDTVVYTHLHHDHVGWTTGTAPGPQARPAGPVGELTFGNARHLVGRTEWEHWAGRDELTGPDPVLVQAPLADRIAFVGDGTELAPGVRVLATPGHTPGHHSLVVTDPTGSTDRRVLILGDVMHCQVQVVRSHWSFVFDSDAGQAGDTRERLLRDSEGSDTIIAGGHFAGSVFGHAQPPSARRDWARI